MAFPKSHEQPKVPEQAPSAESQLAERVTNRRMLAELKLSKLSTAFRNDPEYASDKPLPLPFLQGVKTYLAEPSVDIMNNWPPRPWILKHGVQEAVESFRFNYSDDAEALLAKDKVFGAIEQGLLSVSSHMPSSRQDLSDWRSVLKACHRLRTDELFYGEEAVVETQNNIQDVTWAAIVVKLGESKPNGI